MMADIWRDGEVGAFCGDDTCPGTAQRDNWQRGWKSIKRAGGSDLQSLKNPGRRSALQITPIDNHSLQSLQLF